MPSRWDRWGLQQLLLFVVLAVAAARDPKCDRICDVPVERGGCKCDNNCDCLPGQVSGQMAPSLPSPSTPLALAGGACGPANNAQCSNRQCCSVGGNYCGITAEHCVGTACLAGWGWCGAAYIVRHQALTREQMNVGPSANAIIADPGGACGPRHDAMCPGSQCCSMHEYCGTTSEHCEVSSGCMEKWGTCRDTSEASKASSSSSSSGAATPPPPAAAAAPAGGIPPDRIATIVGATLGGTCALIGLSYTLWKWHHKRKALQINSFLASHSSCGGSVSSPPSWPKVKAIALSASSNAPSNSTTNSNSRMSSRTGSTQADSLERRDQVMLPPIERV